jgi:hypothetical protein
MTPSDAEIYLRLAGERMLLERRSGDPGPAHSRINAAADALVSVGAMRVDDAQAVADGYALALALREPAFRYRDMMIRRRAVGREAPPRNAGPQRVVRCDRVIEQPWGSVHIRYIRLADRATTLYATVRGGESGQVQPSRPEGGGNGTPWGTGGLPLETAIADDRGTTAIASFSGGGSWPAWTGQFRVSPPLSPEARWVDLLGQRLDLADEVPAPEASVEMLPGEDPARRYLWHRVAEVALLPDALAILDAAIEALAAAGALPPGDADSGQAREVLARLQRRRTPRPSGHRRLPEPWDSLLARRGRADGPVGAVVVAAVTPQFDGMRAVLTSLVSGRSGFTADVEISPSLGLPGDRVGHPHLTWWAADDRGNPYLGQPRSWNLSDDRDYGHVEFWPALDTMATMLKLMPSSVTSRAVIRVPLTSMVRS